MSKIHQLAHGATIALRDANVGIGGTIQATYPLSLRYDAEPMDTTDMADATRPEADRYDATNTTTGPVVLTVKDAAEAFGVSPGAIRKRIERGQLRGQKVHGQWRVVLDRVPKPELFDTTNTTNTTRQQYDNTTRPMSPSTTTSEVVSQSEAEHFAKMVADLVEQIRTLAQTKGELDAENRILHEQVSLAQQRADLAEERVDELLTITTRALQTEPTNQEAATSPNLALGTTERGEIGDATLAQEAGQESRLRGWLEWLRRH